MMIILPCQGNKSSLSFGIKNHHQVVSSTTTKEVIDQEFNNNKCVGSSHGWLILVKDETTPYLVNAFSGARIQLPSVGLQPSLVRKAVLSADPGKDKCYTVFVIYSFDSKIAFFKSGGDHIYQGGWIDLNGRYMTDIVCRNDMLFAVGELGNIRVWDFSVTAFPVKKIDIRPSFQQKPFETWDSTRDFSSCRMYLVVSSRELLLVSRLVDDYVREDGVPVYEVDLVDGETNHPLVCPYRTLKFQVYKLNFGKNEWEEVETIGDRVLFLGGNHSMVLSSKEVPECQENSIYFTDDYWDRMDEDYLYGGHDLGVYSMHDTSMKQFYQSDSGRIEPPPFWVLPNDFYSC